jgi:hypothetical protein
MGPTFNLRFCGRAESPNKPLLSDGVSPIEAGRNRELVTGLKRQEHVKDCTGSIRFLFAMLWARILVHNKGWWELKSDLEANSMQTAAS